MITVIQSPPSTTSQFPKPISQWEVGYRDQYHSILSSRLYKNLRRRRCLRGFAAITRVWGSHIHPARRTKENGSGRTSQLKRKPLWTIAGGAGSDDRGVWA